MLSYHIWGVDNVVRFNTELQTQFPTDDFKEMQQEYNYCYERMSLNTKLLLKCKYSILHFQRIIGLNWLTN